MKGYLDTGSLAILIKQDAAEQLKVKIKRSHAVVKDFGGAEIPVIGELNIDLHIGDVKVNVPALIVPNAAQQIELLIWSTFHQPRTCDCYHSSKRSDCDAKT